MLKVLNHQVKVLKVLKLQIKVLDSEIAQISFRCMYLKKLLFESP